MPTPLYSAWAEAIVQRSVLRLGAIAIVMKRSMFLGALCVLSSVSCKGKDGDSSGASAQATASTTSAPAPNDSVGTVRGVVRMTGDEPPVHPGADKIPVGKCFKAHERHRLLFRKAADGALADALVGVTGYKTTLPKPTTPVVVGAEDCSLDQRTVALTLGQSIHFKNRGPTAAMPQLLGLPTPAVMAAVPGGEPIVLTPHAAGRFELIDLSHPYANAEVFVVNYPTITVTGERGQFEIAGVPAGDVKVSVLSPATGLSSEKQVTVLAGKVIDVAFELQFELAKHNAAVELGQRQEQDGKAAGETGIPVPASLPTTPPTSP